MYGGAMASWLVHSSLERAVQVRALAGDTVLHCWARNLALTMPLSTQEYTWVLEVAVTGSPIPTSHFCERKSPSPTGGHI